jgi:hypothetical protein
MKYFHAYANKRKRGNLMSKILNENGRVCTSNGDTANAFVQYYHNLFTTAEPRNISDCLHAIDRKVSPKMNEQLLAAFTEEGVSCALPSNATTKSIRTRWVLSLLLPTKLGDNWLRGMFGFSQFFKFWTHGCTDKC